MSDLVAPPAVVAEFGRSVELLSVRAISNRITYAALRTQLHRGEAEAIAPAAEIEGENILLDDKKARRIARELGLRPLGTVGVILRAKRAGLVPACHPLLDNLTNADSICHRGARDRVIEYDAEAFRSDGGGHL